MKKVSSAVLLMLGLAITGPALAGRDPVICHPNVCVPGDDCTCPTGEVSVIGVIPPKAGARGEPPPCLEQVCLPPSMGAPSWIHCAFSGTTITCEAWPQDDDKVSGLEYRWSSDGVVTTEPAGFSDASKWDFVCGPYLPGPGSTNTGLAIVEIRWKSSGLVSRIVEWIDCDNRSAGR